MYQGMDFSRFSEYGPYMQRLMDAFSQYQETGGTDDYNTFAQRWMAENPYTPGQR